MWSAGSYPTGFAELGDGGWARDLLHMQYSSSWQEFDHFQGSRLWLGVQSRLLVK
jgi:hypothetical protein